MSNYIFSTFDGRGETTCNFYHLAIADLEHPIVNLRRCYARSSTPTLCSLKRLLTEFLPYYNRLRQKLACGFLSIPGRELRKLATAYAAMFVGFTKYSLMLRDDIIKYLRSTCSVSPPGVLLGTIVKPVILGSPS